MPIITLKVTTRALKHLEQEGNWNQSQITVVHPPFKATRDNRVEILVRGDIRISIGDTHAIWHSHNIETERQSADFKRLYKTLSKRPDEELKFLYEKL